jgi:3-oxoacyl-[acyl-carrier protein] reductase
VNDRYLDLVNSGVTQKLAKQLGLPRPARLHRHRPGAPLVDGPVLVLGDGADADTLAQFLSGTSPEHKGWDLDVRRHAGEGTRFAAVVLALTEVAHPEDLAEPLLALAPVLKTLASHGRVVTVSRPASPRPPGRPPPTTPLRSPRRGRGSTARCAPSPRSSARGRPPTASSSPTGSR